MNSGLPHERLGLDLLASLIKRYAIQPLRADPSFFDPSAAVF